MSCSKEQLRVLVILNYQEKNLYFGYTSPSNPLGNANISALNNTEQITCASNQTTGWNGNVSAVSDATLEPTNATSTNLDEFELMIIAKGGSIWNDTELDLNNPFTIEAKLNFGENKINSNYNRGSDGKLLFYKLTLDQQVL